MKYDIVGIGTALVDFTPLPNGKNGKRVYECNPGGSIANFLAAASRQGSRCAFMGKVGKDIFGMELKKALEENGVDCSGMVMDERRNTPCAFVSLDERGDRSFTFYRENMADSAFALENIDYSILGNSRSLHVTSFAFAGETSYESILECMTFAKRKEMLTTFDINWRPFIWKGREQLGKERILKVIEKTDILKVSDEEFGVFSGCGTDNIREGVNWLMDLGPKMVVITNGENGSSYYTRNHEGHAQANQVQAVDTTGAGDCCFAVFIHQLLHNNFSWLNFDKELVLHALKTANLAASYCVLHRGGIASMPERMILLKDTVS